MGFDVDRFYGEVPNDLVCSICLDVMHDPAMLKTCEHTFCRMCIELVLQSPAESRCPIDRTLFTSDSVRKVFPFFLTIHEKLPIKCDFWPECEAKVLLKDIESHSAECKANPDNNIVCQNYCNISLTIAELEAHDCIDYFKSTIIKLKEENQELRKQLAEAKNDAPENIMLIPKAPTNVEINYKAYGSDIKPEIVLNELHHMTKVIKSFRDSEKKSDAWLESGLYKMLLSLLKNNPNAMNILTLTDIRCLYNFETRLNCFANSVNKTNSALLFHILLFDLFEPLVSDESNVLIIDFIEFGVTHLLAQKVQHVTTIANPRFIEKLLMKTAYNFGTILSKIHYIPFKDYTDDIIKETVNGSLPTYDFILSFSSFADKDVKQLLQKLSPFGMFFGFDRRRFHIKKCRLTSDSVDGIRLTNEVLVERAQLESLNLVHLPESANDAPSDTSKAWTQVSRNYRFRSRNQKFGF